MGWRIWRQGGKKLLNTPTTLVEPFYILITTLLSLLLPLSFLLLARLTTAHYLFTLAPFPTPQPSSLVFFLFIKTSPNLLHALISLVSVAALARGLTDRLVPKSEPLQSIRGPRYYASWILLCLVQLCVGFGIEGTIAAGIDGLGFSQGKSVLTRVIFFIGLHETMLYWSKTVVKPVADDTVFGHPKKEKWAHRAVMASSFGTLWWWRLRDEVESMVAVVEVKKELLMGIGMSDFVGWWLYYLTATIGMVRVVKSMMWVGVILLFERVEANPDVSRENEEKV